MENMIIVYNQKCLTLSRKPITNYNSFLIEICGVQFVECWEISVLYGWLKREEKKKEEKPGGEQQKQCYGCQIRVKENLYQIGPWNAN